MIRSRAEYEGAQREWRSLKEFLSRLESASDHPNREFGMISVYKRMYHLWEELEEYYRARLLEAEQWAPPEARVEPTMSRGVK